MMLRSDRWIVEQAENGMIEPFVRNLVRQIDGINRKVISYGVSSYGYDLRLSNKDFRIFRHIPGTVINPKRFNPANLERVELQHNNDGSYFVIPAHSYALCTTVERVRIPKNTTGLLLNKSTMVRCGVVLPATVIEAEWEGHITIEISNSSAADVMLFTWEGIAQLLLFDGEPCRVSYSDRAGKYQNQPEEIVLAKV